MRLSPLSCVCLPHPFQKVQSTIATVQSLSHVQLFVKTVWLVGEEFDAIRCDYPKFKDVEAVKAVIAAEQPTGQYILIKGSNSTKLYQLPELL